MVFKISVFIKIINISETC